MDEEVDQIIDAINEAKGEEAWHSIHRDNVAPLSRSIGQSLRKSSRVDDAKTD